MTIEQIIKNNEYNAFTAKGGCFGVFDYQCSEAAAKCRRAKAVDIARKTRILATQVDNPRVALQARKLAASIAK